LRLRASPSCGARPTAHPRGAGRLDGGPGFARASRGHGDRGPPGDRPPVAQRAGHGGRSRSANHSRHDHPDPLKGAACMPTSSVRSLRIAPSTELWSVALAGLLAAFGHPQGALDTAAGVTAGLGATAVRYALMRSWVFRPAVRSLQGTVAEPAMSPPRRVERPRLLTRTWRAPRPELIGLLVLALVLNLWAPGPNG